MSVISHRPPYNKNIVSKFVSRLFMKLLTVFHILLNLVCFGLLGTIFGFWGPFGSVDVLMWSGLVIWVVGLTKFLDVGCSLAVGWLEIKNANFAKYFSLLTIYFCHYV